MMASTTIGQGNLLGLAQVTRVEIQPFVDRLTQSGATEETAIAVCSRITRDVDFTKPGAASAVNEFVDTIVHLTSSSHCLYPVS